MMLYGMTGILSTHLVHVQGDDVSPNLLLGPVCGIGALQTFVKWAIIGAQ